MKKFLIQATVEAGFWRCGQHFTQTGLVVEADAFDEDQWARLRSEPKLRVSDAVDADELALAERFEAISDAIAGLTHLDFQKDGRPKLDALNTVLVEAGLTKAPGKERDTVFDAMREGGFEPPEEPPS